MINNLNQSSPVDQSQSLNAAQNPNKKASSKDDSQSSAGSHESFDQQLQQQGAIANAQANAPAQASQVNLSKAGLSLGTAATAAETKEGSGVSLAQPKAATAHMNIAEYSPLTAKTAAGVNAGSTVAGLKPWNQEWVFEGMERPVREGDEIRPLIGGAQAEELAEVQAALKQLNAMTGAPQTNGLRSRGEQGLEKAGLTGNDADALAAVNARIASQLPQQLGSDGAPMNLEQAISQMNGEVLGQPRAQLSDKNAKLTLQGANTGAVPSLGGSEFLKTLTLVRGQNGAEAQEDGQQGDASGNRADLKLVENSFGGKGKKLSDLTSGEDSLSSPYVLHSANLAGAQQGFSAANAPVVVTGHVVPGAGVQDQLSHEAVANVSAGIKNLGSNGGEMKIHLRPEGLGELHVKVITQGQQVGLQIQASDENAKKILQDSMSTLKESLASQNLSLAKVDVSVAHAFSGGNDASQSQHQHHQSGQPLFMNSDRRDMMGQNAGQQNQNGNRWNESSSGDGFTARPLRGSMAGAAAASARSAMAAAGAGSGSARMEGRLDVLA